MKKRVLRGKLYNAMVAEVILHEGIQLRQIRLKRTALPRDVGKLAELIDEVLVRRNKNIRNFRMQPANRLGQLGLQLA